MTESEARTKWCPHARYPHWPNECSGGNEGAKCIASDCMMWVADRGPARVDGVEYDSVAYDTGDCGFKRGLRE